MATTNTNTLNRCVQSAANSLATRSTGSLIVLEDIESDLEAALKAVKGLIRDQLEARRTA
jgi:hypothetical protein